MRPVALALVLATSFVGSAALADDDKPASSSGGSVDPSLRGPGSLSDASPQRRHPMLSFFLGFPAGYWGYGGIPFSVGARYLQPILHDGFVPSLNDSFGVEAGVDLYALGCIFYHLLTGFPPYEDAPEIRRASSPDKPASLLFAAWGGIHFNKERGVRKLLPVTRLRPDVPEWIDLFFRKALAREPKNRFQTAQDFLRDLDACLESTRLTPPLAEPKPGHFVFGGVATVLLMLVLVGVWRLNHPAGPVATSVDTPASPSIPDAIVPAPNGLALATPITVPEPPDAESPADAADPSDAAAPVEDAPSVPDTGRRPRSSRRHRDVPTGPRCGGIDPRTGLRIPCL